MSNLTDHTTSLPNSNATSSITFIPIAPLIGALTSLWTLVLSLTGANDWLKLVVIGGVLETCRRFMSMGWTRLINSFFLTVEIDQYDKTFNWMLEWLSRQPAWNQSRIIEINSRRRGGVLDYLENDDDATSHTPQKSVAYLPGYDVKINLWHKGLWIQVWRWRKEQGQGWSAVNNDVLTIQLMTRSHKSLSKLFLEAKKLYETEAEDRIDLWAANTQNEWDLMASRQRRPLSSVVLDAKVKRRLLGDLKDFLTSEKWYSKRGLAWRRGYLLYGSPGSGKTSIIHAIAGELGLDVYNFSLSKKNLDDSELVNLMARIPPRSIAVMEDLDAAFHRGVTREANSNPSNDSSTPSTSGSSSTTTENTPSTGITLAGLLNAIDGVASQEGRILFATTNKYDALDPALCRPGRFDVHLEFKLADQKQAEELFKCFFPPEESSNSSRSTTPDLINLEEEDEKETEKQRDKHPGTSHVTEKPNLTPNGTSSFDDLDDDAPPVCPNLSQAEVDELATNFARQIPNREFSMASLQGLLMQYKTQPHLAVKETSAWVEQEREARRKKEEAKRLETAKKDNPVATTATTTTTDNSPAPVEVKNTTDSILVTPPSSPLARVDCATQT